MSVCAKKKCVGAFYLFYVFNDYTLSKYASKQNTLAGQ